MTGATAPSRIVLVTTSFPRANGDPSGHFVATEASRLQQAGHSVLLLAPGGSREAPGSHLPVVGLGADSLFQWPGALARLREKPHRLLEAPGFLARAWREIERRGPFDRAILHFLVPSGWPLGLHVGTDLEVVCHGSDVRLLLRAPREIRGLVIASLLRRRASFRFVSQELRDALLDGLPLSIASSLRERSRIELPPLALPDVDDIKRRAAELRASRAQDDAPLWVSCARLIPSKRIDLVVQQARRRGATLVIVGDGPERARLAKLANDLDARAHLLGQLPRFEALAWIAAADRLVHLSEAEGAPTVIREARALGIPVLARAVGDVASWAEQDRGIELMKP